MSRKRQRTDNDPANELERSEDEVVLLRDLVPRKDVKGGAKKLTFGQSDRQPSRPARRRP